MACMCYKPTPRFTYQKYSAMETNAVKNAVDVHLKMMPCMLVSCHIIPAPWTPRATVSVEFSKAGTAWQGSQFFFSSLVQVASACPAGTWPAESTCRSPRPGAAQSLSLHLQFLLFAAAHA